MSGAAADLGNALQCASSNPPDDLSLDQTLQRLAHGRGESVGVGSAGSEQPRATACQDGEFMRFLTVAPDHDSTDGGA